MAIKVAAGRVMHAAAQRHAVVWRVGLLLAASAFVAVWLYEHLPLWGLVCWFLFWLGYLGGAQRQMRRADAESALLRELLETSVRLNQELLHGGTADGETLAEAVDLVELRYRELCDGNLAEAVSLGRKNRYGRKSEAAC